jgi:hypothetical protein
VLLTAPASWSRLPTRSRRATAALRAARPLPQMGLLRLGRSRGSKKSPLATSRLKICFIFRASRKLEDAQRWLTSAGSGSDGVIAKRIDLPYQARNREGMQKIKRYRSADCIIGGFRYGVVTKNAILLTANRWLILPALWRSRTWPRNLSSSL